MFKSGVGKRVVTFITTIAMVLSLIPANVFASVPSQITHNGEKITETYNLEGSKASIEMKKSIEQVEENTFDITLSVLQRKILERL